MDKTLDEIVEQALSGEMPTHEECFYAMLVYRALLIQDHNKLLEVLVGKKEIQQSFKELFANNSHSAYQNAMKKPPKEYIGSQDPMTSEYQKQRTVSLKVFDKFMKSRKSAN